MSRTARLLLFGVGAAGFGVVLVYGLAGLPAFGHYEGVYGHVLNRIGVAERHATDLVTALNFDFRAFDTLGEEFILFASVLGVVLILRELRGERERPNQEETDEHHLAGARRRFVRSRSCSSRVCSRSACTSSSTVRSHRAAASRAA